MSIPATQIAASHGKLLLAVALDPKEVGKRIAAARERKLWTQLEFATQHAHVSPSTVARWEAGKLPPVRELMRIADILDVTADSLVEPSSVEQFEVSQRLARLEAGREEDRDLLRALAVKLGVPVREQPPQDEEPAV